jgi:cytidine deaminase
MTLKFTGSFEELKENLGSLGTNWDESQPNKKVFRDDDGAILNWFESTGRLQFQGKLKPKAKMERIVANLLYPEEHAAPKDEARAQPEENTPPIKQEHQTSSLEEQYLLKGGSDSEIIIGVVSPIGTESKHVIDPLTSRLKGFGYTVQEIRVSNILPAPPSGPRKEYSRIKHYMAEGDKLRQASNNNAILATGVAHQISTNRQGDPSKTAYIINSLKHPDEVNLLRKIYGNGFYLFGIHADEKKRRAYLIDDQHFKQAEVDELIKIDEDEKVDYGQRTRDTFHLSDFFVNLCKNDAQVKNMIQRFLELIFAHPYKNPTFDEFAMFMAFNSSARSGDLSRQVGAVITKDRQIIATGANDCPKFGGGLYWAEVDSETGEVKDAPDGKDYTREEDSNKTAQLEMSTEIEDLLVADGLVPNEKREEIKALLKKSKIFDLTEFGRVVHAEMEAMLSCARAGISTIGTTLYCTTFPCHNCAKHLIDAGITRVVYVEPYPKSKALEFHSESIQLKTQLDLKGDDKFVSFEPFTGVGARRFLDLFSMSLGSGSKLKRKDKQGQTLEWSKDEAIIRTPLLAKSYIEVETAASGIWKKLNSQ